MNFALLHTKFFMDGFDDRTLEAKFYPWSIPSKYTNAFTLDISPCHFSLFLLKKGEGKLKDEGNGI